MSKAKFDKAFARFIQRREEKVTASTFYETLAEIEQERAEKVIELRVKIVEGQLRFVPSPDLSVRDNEIVLGNQRIIVKVS